VELRAQLRANGRQLNVEILDLSRSGMSVKSSEIFPSDVLVELTFSLPSMKEPIACEAKILWSDGRGCAGLRFIDLNRKVGTAIEHWMSRHTLATQ
jgi:hypothetical protein